MCCNYLRADANRVWFGGGTYDPAGNRTQMVRFNGSTTQTVVSAYNDGNQLTTHDGDPVSSDANGKLGVLGLEWAYTLRQASIGQIVAEHTATARNAATGRPAAWTHRFHHFDLLGNTTAETDAGGMVANLIDMEAFGTLLEGGQAGFRLTTKEYDTEAGASAVASGANIPVGTFAANYCQCRDGSDAGIVYTACVRDAAVALRFWERVPGSPHRCSGDAVDYYTGHLP